MRRKVAPADGRRRCAVERSAAGPGFGGSFVPRNLTLAAVAPVPHTPSPCPQPTSRRSRSLRTTYDAACVAHRKCLRAIAETHLDGNATEPDLVDNENRTRVELNYARAQLLAAVTQEIRCRRLVRVRRRPLYQAARTSLLPTRDRQGRRRLGRNAGARREAVDSRLAAAWYA